MRAVWLILFFSHILGATEIPSSGIESRRLKFWDILTEVPESTRLTFRRAFTRDAMLPWAGIVASSTYLYAHDQKILDESQRLGRQWGIGNSENTKTVLKAGQYDLVRLPSDTGSILYFLGDGWIHIGTAVGMMSVGSFKESPRAFNTGIEMMHGMVMSTLFNQALKRSTGRESPNRRSEDQGKWRPFPSTEAYNKNTALYDAMPSGHVMTATLNFTILYYNYPEYRSYIVPVGGVWLSALMFQMMNNGVHWASDYPLGIAMGYFFAKMSLRLHEPTPTAMKPKKEVQWAMYPSYSEDAPTLNWALQF